MQQALRHDGRTLAFEKPIPVTVTAPDSDDEQQTNKQQQAKPASGKAPVFAYKYRKFVIDEDKKLTMLVRCTVDSFAPSSTPDGRKQQVNIHTLTEWDPFNAVNINWRQKLESQFAAVLATEVKNNTFRITRWTLASMLANVDLLKLAFVSRANFRDPKEHIVMSVQQFRSTEFMQNINLNVENAWGVLNYIIKKCIDQPAGEYLLVKDPNKPTIRLFGIPSEEDVDTDVEEDDTDDDGAVAEAEEGAADGEIDDDVE